MKWWAFENENISCQIHIFMKYTLSVKLSMQPQEWQNHTCITYTTLTLFYSGMISDHKAPAVRWFVYTDWSRSMGRRKTGQFPPDMLTTGICSSDTAVTLLCGSAVSYQLAVLCSFFILKLLVVRPTREGRKGYVLLILVFFKKSAHFNEFNEYIRLCLHNTYSVLPVHFIILCCCFNTE